MKTKERRTRDKTRLPPIYPLHLLPAEMVARINALADAPNPPDQWIYVRDENGRPLASMPSRAYYEWHIRRGRDIRQRRPNIGAGTRRAVIKRDGLVCGICGGDVAPDDIHIDHVHPLSRGGGSGVTNLRVTHSRCNLAKGASV